MGNASKWKESLTERTASRQNINLMQLVYGNSATMSAASVGHGVDEESSDEEFFKPKGEGKKVSWLMLLNLLSFSPMYLFLCSSFNYQEQVACSFLFRIM